MSEFDRYAGDYDRALNEGLSVSGEGKDFFAHGRLAFLAGRLAKLGFHAKSVLDFGCGTGSATPHLFECLGVESVLGVDISEASVEVARREHGGAGARFEPLEGFAAQGEFDLAFCNGVFHHIPLDERAGAVAKVFAALRPGGMFALWENNPWNPGTRYVMSRIPFDRDAIMLNSFETRRLMRGAGFEPLGVDYMFIFPKFLGALRAIEPALSKLPLGAQYQTLGRKPGGATA